MARLRADAALAERGIYPSREQARAAILAGEVRVGDRVVAKAGELVDADADFLVAVRRKYVSRGGDKLEAALDRFGLDPTGASAIDVGASTGGFTDCLLQRGAAHVVAVDVGYGQLAWSLRTDDRVTVLERTNIRAVDPSAVGAPFDFMTVDVSFISLITIAERLTQLLSEEGIAVMLVKPQFEAGKGNVGKRGVVRDPAIHEAVLERIVEGLRRVGFVVAGLTWSPVRGPEGNIEFLLYARRSGEDVSPDTHDVVRAAHAALGG